MEVIQLLTPQRTGTHFLKVLLSLHSKIKGYNQLYMRDMPLCHKYNIGDTKENPIYQIKQRHLGFKPLRDEWLDAKLVVASTRNPYDTVLSTARLKKQNGKHEWKYFTELENICRGLSHALYIRDNHKNSIVINVVKQEKIKAYQIFKYLGLELEEACREFISEWPVLHQSNKKVEIDFPDDEKERIDGLIREYKLGELVDE
tara:strand:- start:385 stop:990 length:606 start_codon:yes stop_codon:yes gene_type:complete